MLPISGKRCFISQLACFALLPFWLEKYENRNEYICIYILYTYTYVYVCTHARQIGRETLHMHMCEDSVLLDRERSLYLLESPTC